MRTPAVLALAVSGALAPGCLVLGPGYGGDGDATASDLTTDGAPSSTTGGASSTTDAAGTGGAASGGAGETTTTAADSDTGLDTGLDSSTTAATPTCADLECPEGAACHDLDGVATCLCDPGFEDIGGACVDVDECLAAPCPGPCVNTPGGYKCAYPATCAALKALAPAAEDGAHTLYVDGDPARPWPAHCHDMAGAPRDYRTLPRQGGDLNVGRYAAFGAVTTTRYAKVRIDPLTWDIDTRDVTFALSSGNAYIGNTKVTQAAYGAAMTCGYIFTTATIDLRDTPFHVVNNFCTGGFGASGSSLSVNPQVYTNTGGGDCGWRAPASGGCPFGPINGEGKRLRVAYAGP